MNRDITHYEREFPVIVLTGGPCAGKTTALSKQRQWLGDLGIHVVTVPEAATEFIENGLGPDCGMPFLGFQRQLLRYIVAKENYFIETARCSARNRKVVLCDRGAMDAQAYLGKDTFDDLIRQEGFTIIGLRDQRYDAVIHLRSAALGAERQYTLVNNPARRETLEQARAIDEATLNAWIGNPHVMVIDNSTDFDQKMHRVRKAVTRVIGIPVPIEIEHKYRIVKPSLQSLPVHYTVVFITQHYLVSKIIGVSERIRKRAQDSDAVYFRTTKQAYGPGKRIETERQINKREYISLLNDIDPQFHPITKRRVCFVWQHQYFELDIFDKPFENLCFLEIELTEEHDRITLPPFLTIIDEVTGNERYLNQEIARIK